MISLAPTFNAIARYFSFSNYASSAQSIDLPSVPIHEVETAPEKRPRTLKHLIKANHINHSIMYNELSFHNHMTHILGSAYILEASVDQLQKIYDVESKELEEWQESPGEITEQDWRKHLGDRHYVRAYLDFFEDELALKFNYDWKAVVEHYLLGGKEPLINGVVGGREYLSMSAKSALLTGDSVGHPLIHLGYAYELNNKEIAMEALALAATNRNFLHKYVDNICTTPISTYSTTFPLEILHKIHSDARFENLFTSRGSTNIEPLFRTHESAVLEHWNAWTITNPIKQFQDTQEAALALLTRTVRPGTHSYDFFIVHLLTTSHSIRILLPSLPKKFHIPIVRQWWLLVIAVYIAQLRPKIDEELEEKPKQNWKYVEDKALNGEYAVDAHYVKALRAIQVMAFTWGDVHERYLAAAVQFADDFHGWAGFD